MSVNLCPLQVIPVQSAANFTATHITNVEETTSLIPLGNQASSLSSAISPFHLGLSGGTSQKNL
jgi:hypothetical protein